MTERRKYESPIAMPLGGVSTGEGGCQDGSGDFSGCFTGNGYVQPGCYDGPTEQINCSSGPSAVILCTDGTSAAAGCVNGSSFTQP